MVTVTAYMHISSQQLNYPASLKKPEPSMSPFAATDGATFYIPGLLQTHCVTTSLQPYLMPHGNFNHEQCKKMDTTAYCLCLSNMSHLNSWTAPHLFRSQDHQGLFLLRQMVQQFIIRIYKRPITLKHECCAISTNSKRCFNCNKKQSTKLCRLVQYKRPVISTSRKL